MRTTHPSLADSWLKLLIGWAICFVIRLLPYRPPNLEPVMTTLMPFGRKLGPVIGFLFGFLSIALYDVATGEWGLWTLTAGITYGVIGLASAFFLGNTKGTWWQYAVFSLFATLFFDLVTGVIVSPFVFPITFRDAFIGQIPFTINHLIGNVILAVVFSPLIDRWVAGNKALVFPFAKRADR